MISAGQLPHQIPITPKTVSAHQFFFSRYRKKNKTNKQKPNLPLVLACSLGICRKFVRQGGTLVSREEEGRVVKFVKIKTS